MAISLTSMRVVITMTVTRLSNTLRSQETITMIRNLSIEMLTKERGLINTRADRSILSQKVVQAGTLIPIRERLRIRG